jgi:hypothetical protein
MLSNPKTQISDLSFLLARGWIELPKTGTLALWRWRDPTSPGALFTFRDAVMLERSRKSRPPRRSKASAAK